MNTSTIAPTRVEPVARQGEKLRGIPSLNNGERLTRAEFHRRYSFRPDIKKAELIEAVVHVPSQVHFLSHGQIHAAITGWLAVYVAATPGVQLGDSVTLILDMDNEVQPDALLQLDEALAGVPASPKMTIWRARRS